MSGQVVTVIPAGVWCAEKFYRFNQEWVMEPRSVILSDCGNYLAMLTQSNVVLITLGHESCFTKTLREGSNFVAAQFAPDSTFLIVLAAGEGQSFMHVFDVLYAWENGSPRQIEWFLEQGEAYPELEYIVVCGCVYVRIKRPDGKSNVYMICDNCCKEDETAAVNIVNVPVKQLDEPEDPSGGLNSLEKLEQACADHVSTLHDWEERLDSRWVAAVERMKQLEETSRKTNEWKSAVEMRAARIRTRMETLTDALSAKDGRNLLTLWAAYTVVNGVDVSNREAREMASAIPDDVAERFQQCNFMQRIAKLEDRP